MSNSDVGGTAVAHKHSDDMTAVTTTTTTTAADAAGDNNDDVDSSDNNERRDSTAVVPCVLGDCVVQLSHATTYEPPLYLFPELLPRVAQGSAPVAVWDAVADAIDVARSHWTLVNVRQLQQIVCADDDNDDNNDNDDNDDTSRRTSGADGGGNSSSSVDRRRGVHHTARGAAHTLASLIASNRLLAAGLSARVLQRGRFSSAAMIAELARLRTRAGLTADEGAVIMSNHFVNLLAWRKLREINNSSDNDDDAVMRVDEEGDEDGVGTSSTRMGSSSSNRRRERDSNVNDHEQAHAKRARVDNKATTDSEAVNVDAATTTTVTQLPSPDPWSTCVDDARYAGRYIAGRETNVEARVPLLRTLTQLYKRPWRTLASRAVQTAQLLPPGTLNATSPYAHVAHTAAGALLDVHRDLHWPCATAMATRVTATTTTTAAEETTTTAAPFVLVIESSSRRGNDADENGDNDSNMSTTTTQRRAGASEAADDAAHAVAATNATSSDRKRRNALRVPLQTTCTYIGRYAGVQHTALLGAVDVDVGLAAYSNAPQHIGDVHCALVLQPQPSTAAATTGTSVVVVRDDVTADSDNNNISNDDNNTRNDNDDNNEAPASYVLWLVNYSRNGVRVVGARWTLTDAVRLCKGCRFVVGDVHMRIASIHNDDDDDDDDDIDDKVDSPVAATAAAALPVKQERVDD